jgi:hypothetical protein
MLLFNSRPQRRKLMKSDAELRRGVESELNREPSVDGKRIGVAVSNGVVILSGDAASALRWNVPLNRAEIEPPVVKDGRVSAISELMPRTRRETLTAGADMLVQQSAIYTAVRPECIFKPRRIGGRS